MAAAHGTHPTQSAARDRPVARSRRGMPLARDQADSDTHLAPHRPPARPARRSLHRETRNRSVGGTDGRGSLRGPGGPDAGCPHALAGTADERGPALPPTLAPTTYEQMFAFPANLC